MAALASRIFLKAHIKVCNRKNSTQQTLTKPCVGTREWNWKKKNRVTVLEVEMNTHFNYVQFKRPKIKVSRGKQEHHRGSRRKRIHKGAMSELAHH